jgi:ComF family protein
MKRESAWRAMLSVLFPPLCVACGTHLAREGDTLCAACLAHIPRLGWRCCPHCGARTVSEVPACHPKTPYTLIAATSYASPHAQALVKALKYGGITGAASALALITAAAACGTLEYELFRRNDWLMVPIPLHPKRERERGFNQSALFAEALRHYEPLRHIALADTLRRIRNTGTQTERPDYKARRTNVAGCFAVAEQEAIRDKNVLLIDDVTTSGATLEEAARVLKRAGARRVTALVFAKA